MLCPAAAKPGAVQLVLLSNGSVNKGRGYVIAAAVTHATIEELLEVVFRSEPGLRDGSGSCWKQCSLCGSCRNVISKSS
jgi:hypothetical protein